MRYTVDLEHDEGGWWIATARGVKGCHTQGRSIRQALSRIREALALCVGQDIPGDDLEPCVHLAADARKVISKYESTRKRLERDRIAARDAAADAVETLVDGLSLSVRDAGDLLGISHQRVNQLTRRTSA